MRWSEIFSVMRRIHKCHKPVLKKVHEVLLTFSGAHISLLQRKQIRGKKNRRVYINLRPALLWMNHVHDMSEHCNMSMKWDTVYRKCHVYEMTQNVQNLSCLWNQRTCVQDKSCLRNETTMCSMNHYCEVTGNLQHTTFP